MVPQTQRVSEPIPRLSLPWMHFHLILVMLFEENSAYFLTGKHGVLHLLNAGPASIS